jgi:L-methionine (R)-S-oxide reductase
MESTTRPAAASSKSELYAQICEQLDLLLGEEKDFVANAANTSALLFQTLPDVNWVGFYLMKGGELVLGPFQGKPACVRISLGSGVCGTAAAQAETIIVPDVKRFPGHIVCDTASQSEIVVPLLSWGNVVGVLDVDSASLNRFDEDDGDGLETVISVFLASQAIGEVPDLSEKAAGA